MSFIRDPPKRLTDCPPPLTQRAIVGHKDDGGSKAGAGKKKPATYGEHQRTRKVQIRADPAERADPKSRLQICTDTKFSIGVKTFPGTPWVSGFRVGVCVVSLRGFLFPRCIAQSLTGTLQGRKRSRSPKTKHLNNQQRPNLEFLGLKKEIQKNPPPSCDPSEKMPLAGSRPNHSIFDIRHKQGAMSRSRNRRATSLEVNLRGPLDFLCSVLRPHVLWS